MKIHYCYGYRGTDDTSISLSVDREMAVFIQESLLTAIQKELAHLLNNKSSDLTTLIGLSRQTEWLNEAIQQADKEAEQMAKEKEEPSEDSSSK